MVLIDTSVMIDFLRGLNSEKTKIMELILLRKIPFGISIFTYQELLQGCKDEKEFNKLLDYLSTQRIYHPPSDQAFYEGAARLFFELRRKGVTIRSSIDLLIAMTAIENSLVLLHNDRDFDLIAQIVPQLKTDFTDAFA